MLARVYKEQLSGQPDQAVPEPQQPEPQQPEPQQPDGQQQLQLTNPLQQSHQPQRPQKFVMGWCTHSMLADLLKYDILNIWHAVVV